MGLLKGDTLKITYYVNTIKSFFFQGSVSLSVQSNLVYKIYCKGCDPSYVMWVELDNIFQIELT